MGYWLFVAFHIISLAFCIFATRATFQYLSQHQIKAKARYLLFGVVRTRYIGLFYVISIATVSVSSLVLSTFYQW